MRRFLYRLANHLPCRIISDNGTPYLERYYLATILGVRFYLHRFVGSDPARSLRDQCVAAGVPFFFKQWGEWTPGENVERQRGTIDTAFFWGGEWHIHPLNLATDGGHIDDEPDLYRVGKKAAGRHIDGHTWDEVPA